MSATLLEPWIRPESYLDFCSEIKDARKKKNLTKIKIKAREI